MSVIYYGTTLINGRGRLKGGVVAKVSRTLIIVPVSSFQSWQQWIVVKYCVSMVVPSLKFTDGEVHSLLFIETTAAGACSVFCVARPRQRR